jgi:hypothetical protein
VQFSPIRALIEINLTQFYVGLTKFDPNQFGENVYPLKNGRILKIGLGLCYILFKFNKYYVNLRRGFGLILSIFKI